MIDDTNSVVAKRVALIIIAINLVVNSFMMSAVNIALPTIGKEFAVEAVLLGWVVTAMTLPQAAILLTVGRLADIYGRKKIFLFGILLFTVASILCSISGSVLWLIACRVLQGIGGGMAFGTSIALLTSVFPPAERGKAIGISTAAIFFGMSAGPFLGGALTQHLGWRSIFFFNSILCLIVIVLILWKLKGEWADAKGERFDLVGSIIFCISLVVLLYGLTVATSISGILFVVIGILGVVVFIWWEARSDSPILNVILFKKNRIFIFSNVAMLIHICAASAVIFLLSLYLQYIKGFQPQTAGLIILVLPVCTTIVAPISGRLSDRINPRVLASFGIAVAFVALMIFTFLNEGTTLGFVITGLAILGVGIGIFSSPNANAIMGSVEKKYLGFASGMQGTMRSSGQVLGMSIVIVVFSVYIGESEITPEYYPAFLLSAKVAFIIFTALSLCGILAQIAGIKAKRS